MIEIRNGTKKYGSQTVFGGILLSFEKGNYYTLTGPNGSGKSTLLSCLLGQEALSQGEILLDGKVVDAQHAQYSKKVFGLNDSIGWLPGLTVGQHLELIIRNRNNFHKENPLEGPLLGAKEALQKLNIPQAYAREPHMLSSGQEQRARLASLLIRPANYYFLDEPEKRLDVEGVEWIAAWIQARVKEGAMVCIATHASRLNSLAGAHNINFPLNNLDSGYFSQESDA